MASLNAEPALPDEREKQHLLPKSYRDAVEEEAPEQNGSQGHVNRNGANGTHSTNGTNGNEEKAEGHKASVLRIIDTGASVAKTKENDRPPFERQESQHEYSATGLDDTPRSPPRQRHRKTPSQNTNTSQEGLRTEEKILYLKKPKSNGNTKPKDDNEQTTVFEKVEGEKNGSKLVSVKPNGDYEKQLRRDRKEKPLVSGKKAGERWETSSIRFAPLNVPLRRRLQTAVVLFHTLALASFASLFFFLCAIPIFWPILLPYLIYCLTSKASTNGSLSHRSEFLRSLPLWSLFASYFPARLHRTQELPPTRKYIFGYHPHGIISMGAFAAFATESLGFKQLFPGITNTLLTLDSNFRVPIYRDYALAMGLASVSKESCENILSIGGPNKEGMGRAITIVIGGATESLDAQPHTLRLVLQRRKGFVKMAIRTGADLVPVLGFGENDLYEQFQADSHPKIHKFQLIVKKVLGFTIPLFHARGVFNYDVGLMPYRRPVNIVVGRPVRVLKNERPEQADIDRVHEEYVKELERIWELWKDEFAKDRKEEIQYIE